MLLFVIDLAGNVVFLEAQRSVLGVDPRRSVGRPAYECFQQAPEIVERLRSVVAMGEPFAGVIWVAEARSFIDVTCHPMRDDSGAVTGVSGVMIDATERIHAEEARRQAESKSLLIATMNHEARTPLNAILGFSELLGSGRDGELNEGQRRYVANIDSAGRQLLSLVSDAIDLTRIEGGTLVLSPANLGAAAVIDEAIEQLEPLAAPRGVRLKANCPAGLTVHADHARLVQVVWSLGSNAIRFTPHGGIVSISAWRAGRYTPDRRCGQRSRHSRRPALSHLPRVHRSLDPQRRCGNGAGDDPPADHPHGRPGHGDQQAGPGDDLLRPAARLRLNRARRARPETG